MTTFAKTGFNALSYAAFRPTYPPQVFKTVLTYHRGPSSLLLDLGCGHGLISRELSPSFTRVLATDPSSSMITQATSSTPPSKYPNIECRQASAEDLSFIPDGTLDMVVAGQAAHWFDYSKVWPELGRKMRKGGTLAFWGYKDNTFVENPKATKILDHYCYGEETMGPYWEQPGRNILRDKYRDISPPEKEWEDVVRVEYEPGTEGKGSGEGEVLMSRRMKLGEVERYLRTFSAYHDWKAENGAERDILDRMFEEMVEGEPEWKAAGEKWRDVEVENEWGSVILMARKK
ncbi:putative Trans-aconitate 3-methyltransferase [Mollisia scopiformis]|uniref:Putative Trans-aconitate 3-methyltransferase n=1 Tax=Mollisia scopiformis TaxID=149040 RepID=A0A132BFJ7_MOLSC|nr:putative Trans-aconitate 3-methyltransferase [Mollisia scopiformis]KUJ10487.1 putative Trans-aconitate 3-methyltransferase [Mollisia scopiformis]